MTSADHNPILVALDTTDVKRATELRRKLQGSVGGFKIGKEFFTANGPADVRHVLGTAPLFLDLKFHDIPNTVAGAMRAAAVLKPLIVNVHASGGPAMLRAAKQAAREEAANLGIAPPLVIAVTVLTSLDDDDLRAVGLDPPVAGQVERLAKLTAACGLDGVVCSAHEIKHLKDVCGPKFKTIVPGIRPASARSGDQKRTMTPGEAIVAGADYLVIGRPITGAEDPQAAAEAIRREIEDARPVRPCRGALAVEGQES